MRLSGITPESVVDGPGLRIVIFAQGCPHKCPRCHNPESWDLGAGAEFSVRQVIRLLKRRKKNIRGVTFSGGEPFLQAAEFAQAAQAARLAGFDIVTYTGFSYEYLAGSADDGIKALLSATDILIDGKYVHELREPGLRFRGSSNQRVIDLAASRKCEKVVLCG
ncbi:MAG: anaerobic ribonucleoside-triphosphate reductase activating protein [Clostridiales bacterium]|jgi:anaerobic ribonucleoside-triphosphate reductase activating protein|nr:anaerobic ribonucleoside-triphosphate reductase activating protein [Clostridiales bacterium]